jgi:hypothetical protein
MLKCNDVYGLVGWSLSCSLAFGRYTHVSYHKKDDVQMDVTKRSK